MISSTVLFIYFKTSINWLQWSQNSITFSSEQRRGCIHGQTFVCFGKIAYAIKEITNEILEHMYTSRMFWVVRNDAFVYRISIIRITRIEVHCKLKGVQMDTKTLIVSSIMFKPFPLSSMSPAILSVVQRIHLLLHEPKNREWNMNKMKF